MTNKEAIKLLKELENEVYNEDRNGYKQYEALELAVKALMAYRDCKHCTHNIKVGNMRGCALWDCDFEDARDKEQFCEDKACKYRENEKPQGDLIKAFELLRAHCKNRECNKDCVFYRELRVGDNTEQFCGLCEIVTSDERGKEE